MKEEQVRELEKKKQADNEEMDTTDQLVLVSIETHSYSIIETHSHSIIETHSYSTIETHSYSFHYSLFHY